MSRKPKKEATDGEKTVRTNLSLNPMVKQWGYDLAKEDGYGDNFSAFVADLIRRAREKRREMQLANKASRELAKAAEAADKR